jgi:hypothetical protein
MPEHTFRIVFTNELGMKFFDLEIGPKESIVHFCYPSLNRKSLLKLLANDFRLLLFPRDPVMRMKELRSGDPSQKRFAVTSRKGSFYYLYDRESGKIIRIRTSRTIMGKTDLLLEYNNSLLPAHIFIFNSTVRLRIRMAALGD